MTSLTTSNPSASLRAGSADGAQPPPALRVAGGTPATKLRFFLQHPASEKGYVLISAIALAILYFGLMELMLIDSSRALVEAQRLRSRIVASALA